MNIQKKKSYSQWCHIFHGLYTIIFFVLYYHFFIKHSSYPCAKDRQSLSISHSLLQNLDTGSSGQHNVDPNPNPAAASHRVQLSKGII